MLYSELEQDISKIVEDSLSVDPRFKTEKQYIKLSIKEIKNQLIDTGNMKKKVFTIVI